MNKQRRADAGKFYALLYMLMGISVFGTETNLYGQEYPIDERFWSEDAAAWEKARSGYRIQTKSGRTLNLAFDSFSKHVAGIRKSGPGSLQSEGTVVSLPRPDGTFGRYKVIESPIMAMELALKFPGIKTYMGQGIDNPSATLRFDITPKGFHAIMLENNETVYIDPVYADNTSKYVSYYKRDFEKQNQIFSENGDIKLIKGKNLHRGKKTSNPAVSARSSGSELRVYRLAVAATGEYTAFHGGSVTDGLSAIVTSMNRVNGIFEREVAVRMLLVGDNDLIIYTDGDNDPYTNDDTDELLEQNQTNLDNVIGSSNYDIGHVFSTAAGGLAFLEGVCDDGFKAQGATGIAAPVGDPFDVDFVAHEIGHQFGATHTFNGTTGNCNAMNRSGINSFEPGSGTTIMGYAGICSPQNIQASSDDYFHTGSYDQIITFITEGNGSNCPSTSSTGNTPPSVNAGIDYFIPVNTPFTLTGSANDLDGDPLTYCWEQHDLGPASPPNDPAGTGPLFRSFPPVTSPSRTFPQISDILNNTSTLGEILPAITRTMEFRLTVRDNKSGGGGVNYDDMTINVVDLAGKFEITSLNEAETVTSSVPVDISWEVADTDLSPINTQLVNILLSTDGGLTFPVMLAENVDNDGLQAITFPDTPTSLARIKIEAVDNIYFDINDENFSIQVPDTPDFAVVADPGSAEICTPEDAIFTIEIIPVLDFSDRVDLAINNLPEEVEAIFSDNPVIPGNTSTLTISNTAEATPGEYELEITASSGSLNKQKEVNLNILSGNPSGPTLSFPLDEASEVPLRPFLSWVEDPQINTYTFELALDQEFNNMIDSVADLGNAFYQKNERLESNVTYYWRVKGVSNCGPGEYSETFSFTTLLINYFPFASTDVPKTIDDGDPNTVTSTLEIQIVDDIIISDVNVINLRGEHSFISDLKFTLKSPVNTEVVLFANICSNEENFDLSLDDESTNTGFPCPPVGGESYRPAGSLAEFNGQNGKGTWTLIIEDNATVDGGILNSWGLELGTNQSRPNPPSNLQASLVSMDAIALAWKDSSNNEDNFILERSTPDNSNFEEIATLNANTRNYEDTGLAPETKYVYRVKAVNQFGQSAYSQEAEASTLPLAPANLMASTVSEEQIDLTWSDLSAAEEGYVVEQSIGDNQNFVIVDTSGVNTESYSLTGLDEGTTYYFRIYAYNQGGRSLPSAEVQATTLVLGIADEIAKKILVFPNPAGNNIIIKAERSGFLVTAVRLTDIHGKTIRSIPVEDNQLRQKPLTLAIDNYAKGLYLLEIITDRAKVIKRVIKD